MLIEKGGIPLKTFQALVVEKQQNEVHAALKQLALDDLSAGDVLIEVHYSCVNYKDALATKAGTGVIRHYPRVLGIDLSGVVLSSSSGQFKPGDKVLVTGHDLGVTHDGGFSPFARVPSEWIVPLPEGLSLKEAMVIGTAGFTAAQSIHALQKSGLTPEQGPVLVRGATGGVGSMAIAILHQLGYTVEAVSRKKDSASAYLTALGADTVSTPEDIRLEKFKPLAARKWAAVVDPVGGKDLPHVFAQVAYHGAVALSGNAGGISFESTVLPFILRGIKLLGINSVDVPDDQRQTIWEQLSTDWKPARLTEMIDHEVTLAELPTAFEKILNGHMKGRTLVKVKTDSH